MNSRGREASPVAMMVVSMLSVCGTIGSEMNALGVGFFVMAYMLGENGVVRKAAGSCSTEDPLNYYTRKACDYLVIVFGTPS